MQHDVISDPNQVHRSRSNPLTTVILSEVKNPCISLQDASRHRSLLPR
jgi:hypothetical protein